MKTGGFTSTFVLLGVFACVCAISASLIHTSTIMCDGAVEEQNIGPVDENYSGDVELVNGINPAIGVKLVAYIFTSHVDLLELHYTPGDTSATIRFKEPPDAEVLANTDRTLYYAIMCNDPRYANPRTLKVNDLNDNPPKFQQSFYNETISEAHVVNSQVLIVEAKDNDSSPEHNRVTYSIVITSFIKSCLLIYNHSLSVIDTDLRFIPFTEQLREVEVTQRCFSGWIYS